jgi:hypothetical protein
MWPNASNKPLILTFYLFKELKDEAGRPSILNKVASK